MRLHPVEFYDVECRTCGETKNSFRGPDPCMGYLPGVKAACCGHSQWYCAYVMMRDGSVVRGRAAIELIEKLKKERHAVTT